MSVQSLCPDAMARLAADAGKDMLPVLLQLYLDELNQQREALQSAFHAADFVSMRGVAHTLKSSAATFGCEPLADAARQVESACRDTGASSAEQVERVVRHIDPLRQSIQVWLHGDKQTELSEGAA
ncbi:MAG: Hpt domain-containing protein [Pseudomonadota bacterium]|nr:Hpt domain-containing protein [Pseudomonadota bacterium]